MPKLILKFGAAVIKEIPITKDQITIGRKADNDIQIENPIVSGRHARILKQGELYFIEDLNSTNGTFVKQKKIIKVGLHTDDEVVIGKHSLVFIDEREKDKSAQKPGYDEATMVLTTPPPSAPAQPASQPATPSKEKIGSITITSGAVDQTEFELKGLLTYIGGSDGAAIKIKGGFLSKPPEMAAVINRRPEGYILVAVEKGYPKVNGKSLDAQHLLEDGDEITAGSTKMKFYLKEV